MKVQLQGTLSNEIQGELKMDPPGGRQTEITYCKVCIDKTPKSIDETFLISLPCDLENV